MNRYPMLVQALTLTGAAMLAVACSGTDDGANEISGDSDISKAAPELLAATPCINGKAGAYSCKNVDLQSNLPLANMGGGKGSGGWGWTDPTNNKEYAIVARTNGTAFVDVTDPTKPVYLGNLPSATGTSTWRETTVYKNAAYIVSDYNSTHGLQVFDLTRLRSVTAPPVTFTATHRNTSFGRGHTVTVNKDSGFLYVNGSDTCSGGPRVFNLANPLAPTFVSCVNADGYTHDSTIVNYRGPDTRYAGKEIVVASNEDTVTIWDLTNKSSPVQIARKTYPGARYTHQGQFTEDHRYFVVDDELDEQNAGHNSRTYVWNMSNLTNPTLIGNYTGPTKAIDHNQFVRGKYSYQSNYTAGLRIIDLTNAASPSTMTEAGFFDCFPENDNAVFNGTWNNYPHFPSGNVAVFSMDRGLFMVKPNLK